MSTFNNRILWVIFDILNDAAKHLPESNPYKAALEGDAQVARDEAIEEMAKIYHKA